MKNKLRNESGSAMLLAIFLIALVSIVIISFSAQIGNQIKSTMKSDDNIQEKYNAESKVEEGIAKFIQGIKVIYMDDIYKETGVINEEGKRIYKKYIYYKVEYINNKSDDELQVSNNIEDKINDNMISIFSKVVDVDEVKNGGQIIPENKPNPEFDSYDKSKGTKFTLRFVEDKYNKETEVNVNVNSISGENGTEKCNIGYEIISWRN